MYKKLRGLYQKHGDILRYLIIGGITTLIDIAVYSLLTNVFSMAYTPTKVIAWILAVAFAFWGNKWVVFRTKTKNRRQLLRETVSFIAMRLLTLLFSLIFLRVTIDTWGWNSDLSNILCNVVVIVLNYILSKIFVFTENGKQN